GHRPTWFVGVNSWARNRATRNGERRNGFAYRFATQDPLGLFGAKATCVPNQNGEPARPLRPAQRKCLRQLNLQDNATKAESKSRRQPNIKNTANRAENKAGFKALVKPHPPARNGGDRRSEDKLRQVIQAYNYLRQAGLA